MKGGQARPTVAIRAFAEGDFPAIQRLSAGEGWPTPTARPAESLASWRRAAPALVAVAGGEVVGFLRALSAGAVTTYICEVLVAPGWRGRGIGRALVEECHRLAPATRLDALACGPADGSYETVGFRPLHGYRKGRLEE